jgi:signal transduction histidine kinase
VSEGEIHPEIPALRQRILLSTFTVVGWVSLTAGVTASVLSPAARLRSLLLGTTFSVLAFGLRALATRGQGRLAAWCFLGSWLLVFSFMCWTAGGIMAPAIHSFLLVVLLAGLLIGPRAGVLVAVGVVALSFGLAWAQHMGRLPAPWMNHTVWSRWATLVVYAGMVAVFQALATRHIDQALRQADEEIAHRKRTESELQAAHDELERRVQERTEALALALSELGERGDALQEARRDAESANEAKSHFLAIVSHELRGPLTAIQGHLWLIEQMKAGAIPGDEGASLESSRHSAARMLDLLNELLDAERAGNGGIQVELCPLDLGAVVRASVARMEGLAQKRGRSIHVVLPSQELKVSGDAGRLEQVCVNLLSNALRHAQGEGPVEVACSSDRGRVACRVRNPGGPIPDALLPKLFQAFQQAQPSAGTTGLGLYISKAIIEAHGGTIGVESTPEGTEFRFDLPSLHEQARTHD